MSTAPLSEAVPSARAAPVPWSSRYAMVDGWRALAALGVMFSHLGVKPGFNLGHTCVLIFFVLSGYCITASTESCRRNNVNAAGYMFRRLKRIYPPYFFAVLLFIATRLLKSNLGGVDQLPDSIVPWIQNFTLTQWLSLITQPTSLAYENHTLFVAGFWSLNYEEQFYLVMGVLLYAAPYWRGSIVLGAVLLMAPAIIWNVLYPSLSYGFFIEYWVCFALGIMVFYRLCGSGGRLANLGLESIVWAVFLFATVMVLQTSFAPRSVYYEWMVTAGFALMLIYARPLDNMYKASIVGVGLSALSLGSYSLYLTHQMNITSSQVVASALIRMGFPSVSEFTVRALFMCSFAAVFWYFCERPFVNRPLGAGPDKDGKLPAGSALTVDAPTSGER